MIKIAALEDDKEFIRALNQELTSREQFEFGIEAYESVNRAKSSFDESNYDVVLLDYYAPDGTFHDLFAQAKDPAKWIGISSVKRCNDAAVAKGAGGQITKVPGRPQATTSKLVDQIVALIDTDT